MFVIETVQEHGFIKTVLRDATTNTVAEIVPACGAMLHGFMVDHNGEKINVIDHYDSTEDFAENLTAKGFKSSKMSPFACRIKNATYNFEGKGYHIEKFKLGDNAIHGLLYDAVFTVTDQKADEHSAAVKMCYGYRGSDKGYPFHYDCVVTYELKASNALTITTDIINKDKTDIPVHDGWHPYFCFGGSVNDLQLEFQSKRKFIFDDTMIPTGETIPYEAFGSLKLLGNEAFDDCFELSFAECQPLCVLRDPALKIQVEIRPEKNYPYLQIYTPTHRKSLANENLSAPPDAFNNGIGLLTLPAGETTSFSTTYTITSLI